ncbi:hypothetical protein ACFE04_006672 [Oxalis oulophora]
MEHDLCTVLDDQRRELTAAKNLESDLNFAYNLQLQEAITASLSTTTTNAAAASTSRSSPPPPLPEEDDFDYVSLLLENIDHYEQEYHDHMQSQTLTKNMKCDLNQRYHDYKLAREIMNVPEREWAKTGEDYQRPFNEGNDEGIETTEGWRMYVKGLVSEERIRDVRAVVASIGVAVCDFKDNVLFEMKKGLENGFTVSSEEAELEAIVAGLEAAMALDLGKLTFFCDNYLVSGRVQANQSKIATLVNQAIDLKKKFAFCQPSFVSRSEIKFAFKFAREAIISQITWSEETKGKKSLKETCHVEAKLLNGMMAECPHQGCESKIDVVSCGKFLDPRLVEIFSNRMKEASIAVTDKVYCPYQKCSALMSKAEVPWHSNMSCREYKKSPKPQSADSMVKSLAEKRKWRQCAKCNNMVELATGCYHITCRCGYEFCYTCGAEWKKKKPTCTCPIWDERNIIRRQQ